MIRLQESISSQIQGLRHIATFFAVFVFYQAFSLCRPGQKYGCILSEPPSHPTLKTENGLDPVLTPSQRPPTDRNRPEFCLWQEIRLVGPMNDGGDPRSGRG